MAFRVQCNGCNKVFNVPVQYAGKKVKCPCGTIFVVPVHIPEPDRAGPFTSLLDAELSHDPLAALSSQDVPSEQQMPSFQTRHTSSQNHSWTMIWHGICRRLLERKLASAVTIVAMIFLVWGLVRGSRFFLVASLLGCPMACLGLLLPIRKRIGPYGPWFGPWAKTLLKYSFFVWLTGLGINLLIFWAIKKPPEPLLLIAYTIVAINAAALLIFGLTMIIAILLRLHRQFSIVRFTSIFYLCLFGPLSFIVVLGSMLMPFDPSLHTEHNPAPSLPPTTARIKHDPMPVMHNAHNVKSPRPSNRPAPKASTSKSSSRITATLGVRKFSSQAEVQAFNTEVADWLLQRGFEKDASQTFYSVTNRKDWEKPGTLFHRRHDATNITYVFIPDCYDPDIHFQIIAYHVQLKGTMEDIVRYREELESLRREWMEKFSGFKMPRRPIGLEPGW